MPELGKIGVIGAGTMGNGIAQVCALAGCSVVLRDLAKPALDRARDTMRGSLARQVKKGMIAETDADAALARVTFTTDVGDMADRDIVIEAIVEKLEIKIGRAHV